MEPVQLSPQVETPLDVTSTAGIGEEYQDHKPLYEKFGAKSGSGSTDRQLAMIWEYAKEQSELKDKGSVLWEIRKLEMKLGDPPYGQKPWLNLATYISTHKQMLESEKKLRELELHH